MSGNFLTASNASMISCRSCHLLCRQPSGSSESAMTCPRCGETIHSRKPNSISRTWALIIAAFIFYIPANVLPIMTVTSLGTTQPDTILSGVIYFIKTGMWPIALVIFIASVFVPLLKLFILTYLLVSLHIKSTWRPVDRTRLYRITEVVGRWSMVDIYVVTLMVALVKIGAIATIEAGPAAAHFGAVVVITMFAAMSFDPRLIWDSMEERDARKQ
ncbi:MAG: paraquat-inducible membrane protein A [Desulfobacteraceae bacterium]|nr:paraquat-inducible protein A [Desulfobacteraceae bacterium]MBC2757557.1 paraquat-inducible membrane protein A [Desulfobacteraceae bacterium]